MADETKVQDDIGREIVEEQRKSYIRQIDGFKDNIAQVQEAKDNYQKQWVVDNELYGIILKGAKKLEPQFEYEQNPRYWELRNMQGEFKYKMDLHLAESKLKGYDAQIENIQKELDSLQEALAKLDLEE